jgi:hypothetical protein
VPFFFQKRASPNVGFPPIADISRQRDTFDLMALTLALIACGAIALFPLWLLVRGIQRGFWNGRGVDVVRAERPFAFWFGMVMYAVIAAIILTLPIYIAWDSFRRQ